MNATMTDPARLTVGDRIRVLGTPHEEGQDTGVIAEVHDGPAYGIRFDGMDDEDGDDMGGVHRWYVGDELQADNPNQPRHDMPAPAGLVYDFDESKIVRDRKGRFSRNPGGGFDNALSGQAALDSAPVRLVRPQGGHHGDYTGADITGPEGHGTALALAEMEGVEHETTNTYLRSVGKPAPKRFGDYVPTPEDEERRREQVAEIEARVADLDQTMAVSKLPEPVVVYRGVKDGSRMFPQDVWFGKYLGGPDDDFDEQDRLWALWEAGERPDLTGVTWQENAFAHTTVNGDRLAGYARKIVGLEPVAMTIIVPSGTGAVQMSELDFEAELMLERGLTFRVVADNGVDESGVRRLDVEVLPRA